MNIGSITLNPLQVADRFTREDRESWRGLSVLSRIPMSQPNTPHEIGLRSAPERVSVVADTDTVAVD
jgi:hypothetical protein